MHKCCVDPTEIHVDNQSNADDDENALVEFSKITTKTMSARLFSKVMKSGSLMPLTEETELQTTLGKFEVMSSVMNPGTTVPVMNPRTGASYEIIPGSPNGTEYEIASGDTLEDLGEKKIAVLTTEGTLRGYGSRCADVTKSVQAVRAHVKSQHAVCFGLGHGNDHLIIYKITWEINRMRDDGTNYCQDFIIVPQEQLSRLAAEQSKPQ